MKLAGQEISASQTINQNLDAILTEVDKRTSELTDVRPSDPARKAEYDSALKKLGQARGRPIYFDYLGSGAGRGAFVELMDGSVKLDLINGIGVHLFGHSHPRVMKAAMRGAMSDCVNQGNLQPNLEYARLAEKLVALAGRRSRLKHAWITTCGSRANEKALKLTRQKLSPARKILAFERAFAGRTTMMAEVTDNPAFKEGLPTYNEVLRLPFYDAKDPGSKDKTLRMLKDYVAQNEGNISALMFELVQGEGGFRSAPRDFFVPLFEFCKEKKIAVWADEIQTFSRTGELFAFETLDLGQYIDICTVAKVLQVAATIYTEEFNPKPGLIAGTFSGSSAALSAGHEILTMLEDGYFGPNGKVMQIRKKFTAMLEDLGSTSCKGLISDIGGLGLMMAFTPLDGSNDKVTKLVKALFKNGIVSYSAGRDPYRVRFLLPAILTDHEIGVAKRVLETSLLEVSKGA